MSGTTTIRSSRRKSVPTGSVTLPMNHSTRGWGRKLPVPFGSGMLNIA
jgi:hypothetical protein